MELSLGTFRTEIEMDMDTLADAIVELPAAGRVAFLDLLRERFCLNCGDDYNAGHVCYCTRDD